MIDNWGWPTNAKRVLMILDHSSASELQLLRKWSSGIKPPADSELEIIEVDLRHRAADETPKVHSFIDRPTETVVIPVRIRWTPGDGKSLDPRLQDFVLGDPRNPRPLVARFLAARRPGKSTVVVASPMTVAELLDDERQEISADTGATETDLFDQHVLGMAELALDKAEQRLSGRRYRVPLNVKTGIQNSPTYQQAVKLLADKTGQPPGRIRDEAADYLKEMVATPSTVFIDWTGKVSEKIVSLGYSEIVTNPEAVERSKAIVSNNSSALLWTHKSHVDGIALLSVLYNNDFPTPHQMGGINMAFRGVGELGRRSGTIFIRRTFSDNPVYKMALQQYLGYLMDKRFPLSWAFEGTRSRTGKLMSPRYGLLKYAIDAAHSVGIDSLHLVPVSINYDLIGETGDYVRQEAGQAKQAESLSWFVNYLERLRSPLGRIYLDFAEPVVVPLDGEMPDDAELGQILFEVARRVNALVPVTLPALMCMVLLSEAPRGMTLTELDYRMRNLIVWLRQHKVPMASSFDEHDLDELQSLADIIFDKGIVSRYTGGTEAVFSIEQSQEAVAGYYRNSIVHYFVDKAMTELALLAVAGVNPSKRPDAFRSELLEIRDILKFDFFHTPSERFVGEVHAELDAAEPEWETNLGGSPEGVHDLVASLTPLVGHATLGAFIQGYWVAADQIARLKAHETWDESTCVSTCLGAAEQAFRLGQITTRASISKQIYKTAFQLLDDRGLLDIDEPGIVERRRDLAQRLDHYVTCLDKTKRAPWSRY